MNKDKTLKLWCCSDIHQQFEDFFPPTGDEAPDLILVAGDLQNVGGWKEQHKTIEWLQTIRTVAPVLLTPGNHDFDIKDRGHWIKDVVCMEHHTVQHYGLRFGGASLSPCFDYPALATRWCRMTTNRQAESAYYGSLDPCIDILVSHCPPASKTGHDRQWGQIGSPRLLHYIEQHQPKLVVCGHVHDPLEREESIGETKVINVATISKMIEV